MSIRSDGWKDVLELLLLVSISFVLPCIGVLLTRRDLIRETKAWEKRRARRAAKGEQP